MLASSASIVQRYQYGNGFGDENPVDVAASKLNGKVAFKKVGTIDLGLLPEGNKLEVDDVKKCPRIRPEHAVHLIPAILLFCGLVLWLLSSPSTDLMGGQALQAEHRHQRSQQGDLNPQFDVSRRWAAGRHSDFSNVNRSVMDGSTIEDRSGS